MAPGSCHAGLSHSPPAATIRSIWRIQRQHDLRSQIPSPNTRCGSLRTSDRCGSLLCCIEACERVVRFTKDVERADLGCRPSLVRWRRRSRGAGSPACVTSWPTRTSASMRTSSGRGPHRGAGPAAAARRPPNTARRLGVVTAHDHACFKLPPAPTSCGNHPARLAPLVGLARRREYWFSSPRRARCPFLRQRHRVRRRRRVDVTHPRWGLWNRVVRRPARTRRRSVVRGGGDPPARTCACR
jgi:hypothetical protein